MQNPIVRTFMQLNAAEEARRELLAAGIGADDVEIHVRVDESGPVQGNFTVGDSPAVTGKTAYSHTFAPTAQDAVRDCQLMVNAADPAQAERAAAIMERLGGHDPEQTASRALRH